MTDKKTEPHDSGGDFVGVMSRVLDAFDDLDLYEKCTDIIAEGRAALASLTEPHERGGDFAAAQRDALAECYGEALELLASVLQNDEIQEGFNAANLGDLRDKIKNFLMCKPPHTRGFSEPKGTDSMPQQGGV